MEEGARGHKLGVKIAGECLKSNRLLKSAAELPLTGGSEGLDVVDNAIL
jgi:hypothetical protein